MWHAPVGDVRRSEPKCLTFQGPRHKGTDGAGAAEILVRPDDESLDPVCDGAKRTQIVFRKLSRPSDVLEILEEEEISGLSWHGISFRSEPKTMRRQRSELNAARTSAEKSSGSSQAAKWPPLSTSLK